MSPIHNAESERRIAAPASFAHHGATMNAGFRLKVWAIRLFGVLLASVGILLVAQLAVLLVWQYSIALDTRAWPRLPGWLLFTDHSPLTTKSIAPFLQFIPELQWDWIRDPKNPSALYPVARGFLGWIHIGVLPALLGALLALKGVRTSLGQRYRLSVARQLDGDRVRRIHEYRKRQQPDLSAGGELMDEQTDFDLIEAAERAWRQERVNGGRH